MSLLTKNNFKFSALMFLTYSCICVMSSYIVAYLEWLGVKSSSIGIVLAASAVINVLAQIMLGYLGDYIVTIKKILFIATLVAFAITFFLPFLKQYYVIFVVAYLTACIAEKPVASLVSSYTAKAENTHNVNYSFARAFGSLGFAVSALILGKIIATLGHDYMFYFHSVVLIAEFLMLIYLPEIAVADRKKNTEEHMGFFKAIGILLKIPEYPVFMVTCTVAFAGVWGCTNFVPTLVTAIGRDSSFLGLALFIGAFVELPMFFLYIYISRFTSSRKLIWLSLIILTIRSAVVAVSFSGASVIFSEILMGLGYSIFAASYIEYIQRIVPKELMATAVGVTESLYNGISSVVGNLAAGFIIAAFGIRFLFAVGGICVIIAALIFAIGNYILAKKKLLKSL